ncbi:MAG: hypothetical protein SOH63_05645, partial [Olsenella sp.]
LGDWEDDTVVGPGSACLLVLADRASRLLLAGRCRHDSASVSRCRSIVFGKPLCTKRSSLPHTLAESSFCSLTPLKRAL